MREGYVCTPEHKAKVRKAALIREATIRKKVSINGKVYDNQTRAALALGVCPRTIRNYINSTDPKYSKVFHL